jgi:nucleotide-binding universal stress UspA family protein
VLAGSRHTTLKLSSTERKRMSGEPRPLVVGFDGSHGAHAALEWALEDARTRRAAVNIVHAYSGMLTYGSLSMFGALPIPELDAFRAGSQKLLTDAAEYAAEVAPDIEVSTAAYDGDPVRVLLQVAAGASVLLLGSRRLGAFGSAVLGSVSGAVARSAHCPVVVVRGPAGLAEEETGVVVGVDGRADCAAALDYAFDFADRHHVPLHAVLCWHPDLLAQMTWRPDPPVAERAAVWLAEALAGRRERYPGVDVHPAVVKDHPVAGLVAASNGRQLLVVGSRGRDAMASTILGSVSQGVLHHATCPVAVVRAPQVSEKQPRVIERGDGPWTTSAGRS